jgi:hypothetical protein
MPELGQSRLCFKVMGDVSNLGLNDNEMTLRGIETIPGQAQSQAQCAPEPPASSPVPSSSTAQVAADGGPASRYQLQKASVSANSVDLEFKYTDSCGPNVQLTLTQIP